MTTNPYAFGLGQEWFIMKTHGRLSIPLAQAGTISVIYLNKNLFQDSPAIKFKKKSKNTIVIGSERIGAGEVIYVTDNPYFRAFWKSGRVLAWEHTL
ncbi:MAG: hypothetical protein MZV63_36995 [Marinilabiliales bacterium]|nr:hypothetical protein [Marinilabiliales bacterium]